MTHRDLATPIFAVLATFALVACSEQAPLVPDGTAEGLQDPMLAQPVAGTYTQSFVSAGEFGVNLVAFVTDASGDPAQSGTAMFQNCSLQGVPAPSTDCDTGSGSWRHVGSAGIIPSPSPFEGQALLRYDRVPSPGTTIGFRFRYIGQGNGIENGESLPQDYTF